MNKLLFFFKTYGIKYEYIGEFQRIGLKKDNTFSNYNTVIDSYSIQCNGNNYILDYKKKGRPQYILKKEKIIINAVSQPKFLEKFKVIEKVEKIKIDRQKEKIQGTAFRKLRHFLKLNKKQFGQSINKSENTIIRYEAGSLALHSDVVLAVLTVHNLKLSIYKRLLEETLISSNLNYSFNDFHIVGELERFYNKYGGIKMSDFLTADDISIICKIKKAKAYRIIKEINEEMERKGYIIIRGRVNRRFFNEKLGIQDTDKGGKA